MKWFFAVVILGLVGFFAYCQRNSSKSSYVNGLPQYTSLPGRQFIFQKDCYIFKLKDHNTSWPLVGTHAQIAGLPAEVDRKNIGVDLPDVRILDVVKTGVRFKLVSVRRDESRSGTSITFEILLLEEVEREFPRPRRFLFGGSHSGKKWCTAGLLRRVRRSARRKLVAQWDLRQNKRKYPPPKSNTHPNGVGGRGSTFWAWPFSTRG